MNIGIVVHGPNIIDSGYALKLINLIGEYGDVSVRLGGTMGRTAVIEKSLEDIIDIRYITTIKIRLMKMILQLFKLKGLVRLMEV